MLVTLLRVTSTCRILCSTCDRPFRICVASLRLLFLYINLYYYTRLEDDMFDIHDDGGILQ